MRHERVRSIGVIDKGRAEKGWRGTGSKEGVLRRWKTAGGPQPRSEGQSTGEPEPVTADATDELLIPRCLLFYSYSLYGYRV